MSRGPTRRVQALIESDAVSPELLAAADHEADLLAHPYIGLEHLETCPRADRWRACTAVATTRTEVGASGRGIARTQAAQRRAQRRDR